MPELIPVPDYLGSSQVTTGSVQPLAKAKVVRKKYAPGELSGLEAAGEESLVMAEELLDEVAWGGPAAADREAESTHMQAAALLQKAVGMGCQSTKDSAIVKLLLLLEHANVLVRAEALTAIKNCSHFPASLAADAVKLLMQRQCLPEQQELVQDICRAIAVADPGSVLCTCVDIIPRARAPDLLGFDCLLEPLRERLLCAKGENLLRAVVMLCDDLGGPPPRAAQARKSLAQLAAAAGDGLLLETTRSRMLRYKLRKTKAPEHLMEVLGNS